jgi:putative ABC transport system permease protein
VFSLPLSYAAKIRGIDGVAAVGYANWFGGVYKDPKNSLPQFAISGQSYLDLYPDFVMSEPDLAAFLRDRQGA